MALTNTSKKRVAGKNEPEQLNAFELRSADEPSRLEKAKVHLLGPGIICDTEPRGFATPQGRTPFEIVVDASGGFIPLWAKHVILRWRFRERSLSHFANPTAAKNEIRRLFGEALLRWEDAAPIRFKEDDDVWDFEIVVRRGDDCSASGCVLASAFFPDAGRHELVLYPMLFSQSREEQVETVIHEIGHIFGLRHFFANIKETEWPSEIFGAHDKFSIMNYGELSELTSADKDDIKKLYQLAWTGELTHINGTPIRLTSPFSSLANT